MHYNSILTWLITLEDFITDYTSKEVCLLQHGYKIAKIKKLKKKSKILVINCLLLGKRGLNQIQSVLT
jgi:hypothetical protein